MNLCRFEPDSRFPSSVVGQGSINKRPKGTYHIPTVPTCGFVERFYFRRDDLFELTPRCGRPRSRCFVLVQSLGGGDSMMSPNRLECWTVVGPIRIAQRPRINNNLVIQLAGDLTQTLDVIRAGRQAP